MLLCNTDEKSIEIKYWRRRKIEVANIKAEGKSGVEKGCTCGSKAVLFHIFSSILFSQYYFLILLFGYCFHFCGCGGFFSVKKILFLRKVKPHKEKLTNFMDILEQF